MCIINNCPSWSEGVSTVANSLNFALMAKVRIILLLYNLGTLIKKMAYRFCYWWSQSLPQDNNAKKSSYLIDNCFSSQRGATRD